MGLVKNHLMDIGQRYDDSLDLMELHHITQDIQEGRNDFVDPTEQILNDLNDSNSEDMLKHSICHILELCVYY